MKFNYPSVLFSLLIFCYACKKETTINIENYPNYHFGKYSPFCGFAPPCSDRFWLINQEGLLQIGDAQTNVFTSIDNLGQIKGNLLNTSPIDLSTPIPNAPTTYELNLEGIGTIINQVSTINASCYTFENATAIHNTINYFVLIPLVDNQFQLINLNSCANNGSDAEKQKIASILDWLMVIDKQLGE